MMNISKIIAAGALATSLAAAQEDAWPTEEQTEEQVTEQADEQAAPAEDAEQSSEAAEPQSEATETRAQAEASEPSPAVSEPADTQTAYADAPQKQSSFGSKVGFGIHGDFNYSFLKGLPQDWYGGDDAEAPAGMGFDAGLRIRVPMVEYLQFVPEVNFHYAVLTQQDETAEHTFTQMDLEVPLMVRGIVKDMFYIAAGVQLSVNLSSKVAFEEDGIDMGGGLGKTSIDYREEINQAGFAFGLAFGAGAYVMERLSIDVGFILGLTDVYPDIDPLKNDLIDNMDGGKQMTFKAGVGFWFM